MSRTVHVKCLNNNTSKCYPLGTSLKDVAEDLHIQLANPIIGAFSNNRLKDLSFELYHPQNIRFIDHTEPDGMRMYIDRKSVV